jgi:hypothetical protein
VGDIVAVGEYLTWSYDEESETLLLSNETLSSPDIERVGSRKLGDEDDGFRVTIPCELEPPKESDSDDLACRKAGIPDGLGLDVGDMCHVLYPENIEERDERWCLVIENETLVEQFVDTTSVSGDLID